MNKENLLGNEFIYKPTGDTFKVYNVREYDNGNHKLYMENIRNNDDQVAYSLAVIQQSKDWQPKKLNAGYETIQNLSLGKQINDFYDKNELPRPNFISEDGLKAISLAKEISHDKAKMDAVIRYLKAEQTIPIAPSHFDYRDEVYGDGMAAYQKDKNQYEKELKAWGKELTEAGIKIDRFGLKDKIPQMEASDFKMLTFYLPGILKDFRNEVKENVNHKPWQGDHEIKSNIRQKM